MRTKRSLNKLDKRVKELYAEITITITNIPFFYYYTKFVVLCESRMDLVPRLEDSSHMGIFPHPLKHVPVTYTLFTVSLPIPTIKQKPSPLFLPRSFISPFSL